MSNTYILIFGAGISATLALAAIAYGVRALADLSRRVAKLEEQLAAPFNKHSAVHRERHDIGESALFDLSNMRDLVEAMQAQVEYASQRYAHVAAGGRPDDPPTKWKKEGDK